MHNIFLVGCAMITGYNRRVAISLVGRWFFCISCKKAHFEETLELGKLFLIRIKELCKISLIGSLVD